MRLLPYVASTITRYLQIMNSPINADQSLCAQPLSPAAQRKRDRKRIGWLAGYGAMILPAYIPRWWYALMDHRVVAHYGGISAKPIFSPANAHDYWRAGDV